MPELSHGPHEQRDEIVALLQRRNRDGSYRYSTEEVRHFLPLMVLSTRVPIDDFPLVRTLMLEFYARLGIGPRWSAGDIDKAVRRYYAANPVNAELYREFRTYCLGQAKCVLDPERAKRYARLTTTRAAPTAPAAGLMIPGAAGNR